MKNTDKALWTKEKKFGAAGGPEEVVLTIEGRERAFSVGAQIRRGEPLAAVLQLSAIGGEGYLTTIVGARHTLTSLGYFHAGTWAYLRELGLIESFERDGIRLTAAGHAAVARGHAEQQRLLARCKQAAAKCIPS